MGEKPIDPEIRDQLLAEARDFWDPMFATNGHSADPLKVDPFESISGWVCASIYRDVGIYPMFARLAISVLLKRMNGKIMKLTPLGSSLDLEDPEDRDKSHEMTATIDAEGYEQAYNDMVYWHNAIVDALVDGEIRILPSGKIYKVEMFHWLTSRVCPEVAAIESTVDNDELQLEALPGMVLIRKGKKYWWGGLNSKSQYRGKQDEIRKWFENQGADKTDAATFAKVIAPEWVLKGGRVYESKECVAKLDDA